jgi:hypothetical protein
MVLLSGSAGWPDDRVDAWLKAIRAVSREGAGSAAARAAWDQLVAQGPKVLPRILEAMDTPDTVVVNWLTTAFERIVAPELKARGKLIDTDALLAFVRDAKRQGRARRLALEVVEKLRPGTSAKLIGGWLDDPEFRYEAVAAVQIRADALAKKGFTDEAVAAYREAFAHSRDLQQARDIAAGLKKLEVTVSIAEHLGFLTDWYVIGPFDAMGMKGFRTVYPPEEKVDLAASLPGKGGMVQWKRLRVRESAGFAAGRYALVDLRAAEALGDADDAVAYAYTEFTIPQACRCEFRGAADDNLTVWVNGKREFGFEEYRNGVRLDRHRFRVPLRQGVNTVLVKICQAPRDPNNNEPNWEFMLRLVDATGKGIAMTSKLPAEKGQ